ncbi:MAG: GSCFA domain-containing protein [Proteobacteria bacterium]|nr:GSCFA domain-containing protein [Pseudomonadota bacterium]
MSLFRTDFELPIKPLLHHKRAIVTLGSCFAGTIGQKLLQYKWQGLNESFGTLFQPTAIERLLTLALGDLQLDPDLFVLHDGVYFHYDLPHMFYADNPENLQISWQKQALQLRHYLTMAPCLLITLGSAIVYQHKASNKLVANCHKQPHGHFHKRLLSIEEVQNSLDRLLAMLPGEVTIICSLSPVRHIRDTLQLNSVSKSILRLSLHNWTEKHQDRINYFPAFEILLDDLRDYRFYAEDMIHPNALAIDYIWDKFCQSQIDLPAQQFVQAWEPILKALQHRPHRPHSPSFAAHLRRLADKIVSFPDVDTLDEQNIIRDLLDSTLTP